MEKLLGTNYKWWYLTIIERKIAFISRWNILIIIARFLIPLAVIFILFSSLEGGVVLQTYLIIASLIYQFYAFVIGPAYEITNDVINGKLASKLLRPTSYWMVMLWRIIGYNLLPLTIRLSIFGLTIYFFNIFIDLPRLTLTIISFFPIIFGIGFLFEKIIGSLVFFNLQANKTFLPFFYDLMPFLSGSLISFSIIPDPIKIVQYLPFAHLVHFPMQFYLRQQPPQQLFFNYLVSLLWLVALVILANLIYNQGLKKNESVGL
jgi:ABC-type uncharacterized transport system permease subunit